MDKERHFKTAQAGYLKNNLKQEVGFLAKGGVVGVEYWRTYGTPEVDIRNKDIQRGKVTTISCHTVLLKTS